MRRTYDRTTATSLVPLLDAITTEMVERSETVRSLTRQLRVLRRRDATQDEILNLQAVLATQPP